MTTKTALRQLDASRPLDSAVLIVCYLLLWGSVGTLCWAGLGILRETLQLLGWLS
jgi:hypothetical protein